MRKHETAVCGTARTVVWEVGKCENRRQMPFMISIYLLPDWYKCFYYSRLKRLLPLLSRFFIFSFELFFSVLSDESLSLFLIFFMFIWLVIANIR
mgnify:CR=1 FL=1